MNASHRRSPTHHRRRDRSTSEERPRTKTYNDRRDSYTSDYSDDFEPDTKSRSKSPSLRKRNGNYRRRDPYSSDYSSTSQLHSSATSKKSIQSLGRRRGAKGTRKNDASRRPGWRTHSISKEASSRRDPISSRLLSAKQRKIEEMQNELFETEQKFDKIQKENKLLKTLQHRQDKALRRFEDTESDLPRIIAQNYEDQRVLKTRLKRTQEAEKVLESKLRENNDEMQKMENVLRRLKKIVYDKNLGERSELSRQLNSTENNLEIAERKIKELEKKLELTTSSFTRQINSERQKHKETKETLNSLQDEYKGIKARLREKERALDVSNIYALRKKDSPEKSFISSSVRSTPRREKTSIVSSGTQTDLAIMPANSHETRRSAVTNVPQEPRHAKKKEFTSDFTFSPREASPRSNIGNDVESSKKVENSSPTMNGLHSSAIDETLPEQRGGGLPVFLTTESPTSSRTGSLLKDDFGGEIQARKSPQTDRLESSAFVSNHEQRSREEEELRMKREQEEAEKKKKALEAQKQKASLLAKLREVEDDSEKNLDDLNALPSLKPTKPSAVITHPKSKAELVKSLLGSDTDPVVENLHQGKPSLIQSKNKPEKELSFGGYAPSVGSTSSNRNSMASRKPLQQAESENGNDEPLFDLNSGKQNKKSDLMSQLFGTQNKTKNATTNGDLSSSEDFLFDSNPGGGAKTSGGKVTPRAKPVHSGYPWEKNVVTSGAKPQTNHENHLVRQKSVTSAASFHDEDIEELSL